MGRPRTYINRKVMAEQVVVNPMLGLQTTKYKCPRCHYSWFPRYFSPFLPSVPKSCPSCKMPFEGVVKA